MFIGRWFLLWFVPSVSYSKQFELFVGLLPEFLELVQITATVANESFDILPVGKIAASEER